MYSPLNCLPVPSTCLICDSGLLNTAFLNPLRYPHWLILATPSDSFYLVPRYSFFFLFFFAAAMAHPVRRPNSAIVSSSFRFLALFFQHHHQHHNVERTVPKLSLGAYLSLSQSRNILMPTKSVWHQQNSQWCGTKLGKANDSMADGTQTILHSKTTFLNGFLSSTKRKYIFASKDTYTNDASPIAPEMWIARPLKCLLNASCYLLSSWTKARALQWPLKSVASTGHSCYFPFRRDINVADLKSTTAGWHGWAQAVGILWSLGQMPGPFEGLP